MIWIKFGARSLLEISTRYVHSFAKRHESSVINVAMAILREDLMKIVRSCLLAGAIAALPGISSVSAQDADTGANSDSEFVNRDVEAVRSDTGQDVDASAFGGGKKAMGGK